MTVHPEASGWWWLSFAGDEGFRGAAIVAGDSLVSAAANARRRGCNPGGQVVGVPVPIEELAAIPPDMRHRTLSAEECTEHFDAKSLAEWDRQEAN